LPLVCAVWMSLRSRPVLAGLFFALSCQIKIVPLLLLPAFVFFWLSQGNVREFLIPVAITTAILWLEPLLNFPVLFAKNVLAYGSYWGMWGITYCLRLTGLPGFSRVSFFDLELGQTLVITVLKMIIVIAALIIAWQRRHARGLAFVETLAWTWLTFFILAPGVCPQYMVWLAPFILLASPSLYTVLAISSSIFLFFFYNITSGGWPWSVALAMDESSQHWIVWSLVPWSVLIAGAIALWLKRSRGKLDLPFVRLAKLRAENA